VDRLAAAAAAAAVVVVAGRTAVAVVAVEVAPAVVAEPVRAAAPTGSYVSEDGCRSKVSLPALFCRARLAFAVRL